MVSEKTNPVLVFMTIRKTGSRGFDHRPSDHRAIDHCGMHRAVETD